MMRRASLADFVALPDIEDDAAQAFAAVGLPEIAAMPPQDASFYENLSPSAVVFLACEEACAVGFAVGMVKDGQGYLRELSVRRSFSGRGIGGALLENVISWARAQKFRFLTLTTFCDVPFNGPFYAKRGFVPFLPDAAWPELAQIRAREKESGLDALRARTAMRLDLAAA